MARFMFYTLLLALAISLTFASPPALKLDFKKRSLSNDVFQKKPQYLNILLRENGQRLAYFVNITVGTPPQVATPRPSSYCPG